MKSFALIILSLCPSFFLFILSAPTHAQSQPPVFSSGQLNPAAIIRGYEYVPKKYCPDDDALLWDQYPDGFKKTKIETVTLDPLPPIYRNNRLVEQRYSFEMDAVLFVDASGERAHDWTKKDVIRRLNKISRIFAQCGISISPARIIQTIPPDNKLDLKHKAGDPLSNSRDLNKIVQYTPAPQTKTNDRVRAYYLRSFSGGDVALAGNQRTQPDGSPHINKIWISNSVLKAPENSKLRSADQRNLLEVHELAHVFLNDPGRASDDPTPDVLAHNYDAKTNIFTDEQCERMKQYPLITETR